MEDFPQALYRQPGRDVQTDSGWCAYKTADNAEDLAAALADGWHATSPAAADAFAASLLPAAPPPIPDDTAPPTRSELERKAEELGIKVDGRWSDKKLSDTITAALED